jgi:hypothetical protein
VDPFYFYILVGLVLNSGFHACKAGTLPFEPHLQSIFALVILEMGFLKLFTGVGLEP